MNKHAQEMSRLSVKARIKKAGGKKEFNKQMKELRARQLSTPVEK